MSLTLTIDQDRVQPTPARLDPAQIQRFHEEGFIAMDAVSDAAEIAQLRVIFARLFGEHTGRAQGAQFDMMGHDDESGAATSPQLLHPVRFAPELRKTRFRQHALEIARQLLGPDAEPAFEHAILKPAGVGAPTPWHQDEAARTDPENAYEQISIWMPLQDVTAENGCMHFVPGSHREGILPHRSPNNDPRIHAIECALPIDMARAVACPLPAGGATIHGGRTLHYAGPNRSGGPRAAYILAFRTPLRRGEGNRTAPYPWILEKRTARLERERASGHGAGTLIGRARRKVLRIFGRD